MYFMAEKTKILMIEDDPFFSRLCSRALEEEGYEVVVAPDGEKGLELIEPEKPDLVLLDIILPKMNGFEVLGKIREHENEEVATKKVIILSNLYAKEEEEKGKKLRANDYLIKANITSDDLVKKVKEVL
jgi:two-component system alkaline phosphatase synthesis response regulator PhoP